jgi:transcriptional regulator with XRE-family HTH domain
MKFSGKKLKALIHSKGLRSEYVARQIGITPNYLSNIFSGRREPSVKVIESLCAVIFLKFKAIYIPHSLTDWKLQGYVNQCFRSCQGCFSVMGSKFCNF